MWYIFLYSFIHSGGQPQPQKCCDAMCSNPVSRSPQIYSSICPIYISDTLVNSMHVSCQSDKFDPKKRYLGLVLWQKTTGGYKIINVPCFIQGTAYILGQNALYN